MAGEALERLAEDRIVLGNLLLGLGQYSVTVGADAAATGEILVLPGCVGRYGASGTGGVVTSIDLTVTLTSIDRLPGATGTVVGTVPAK
jgi:hypothetical protein